MQIVTTHRTTDFDGLASLIAATLLYPGAVPILPEAVHPNVKAFLSLHKDMFAFSRNEDIDLAAVKRLIVVDTDQWDRLDRMHALKNNPNLRVDLWDHHNNHCDLDPDWSCREPIGANITLMVRALKEKVISLTPIQATLFLCGLYEDTGSLIFPSTTVEDVYAAAYLLEQNADLNIVRAFLQYGYGEKQKDTLYKMLKTAEYNQINNHSMSVNITELNGHVTNLSLVVNMYRDILNVDVAFGIFVHNEAAKCIVIGRSTIPELNIGSILRNMGGGGHPGAGSAMLKSVKPAALKEWILELLNGNQESSIRVWDIMSYPVNSVESDTTMSEVAAILTEKKCSGIPVIEDGKLVGVISRRDFHKIRNPEKMKSPVKAFMSRNPITITPDKSPVHAARLMVKHDVGRLPVMEGERVIGIVSRTDTMRFFYDMTPEKGGACRGDGGRRRLNNV